MNFANHLYLRKGLVLYNGIIWKYYFHKVVLSHYFMYFYKLLEFLETPLKEEILKKILIFLVVFTALSYIVFNKSKTVEESIIHVSNCSIMQDTCHVKINELSSLSFDASPKGLPPTKVATVTVQLNNIQANKIEVLFTGVELNYSSPKIDLNKINNQIFNGRVFLSLCTLQKTNWVANMTVYTDTHIWKIAFPFIHSGDGYNIINPSSLISQ